MIDRATSTPRAGSDQTIVACAIGDDQYALRGADACEITRADRLRRAGGPEGAVGTLDLHGETVPVFSLATVLARPPRAAVPRGASDKHVVITRGSAGLVGWLVDRTTRSSIAGRSELIPLPAILGPGATRWFEGLLRIGDRSLLVLTPANLDPRESSQPATTDRAVAVPPASAGPAIGEDSRPPLVVLFSTIALTPSDARRYALSARRVAAVIHSVPITPVPGSAPHIAGLMWWQDAVVPVIDVRDPSCRAALAEHARYLVARYGPASNDLVAFAVSAGVALHQPTRADRALDVAIDSMPPFVAGVFNVGGDPVALLDLPAMTAALSH
jgi:chemotaxis signal transduction protein